ncbi:MAG: ORF6N domain-containing protein [Pseudomonadota bacterium]
MAENKIINADKLQGLIYTIRGVQVMYDSDLAELYGVEIKRLNEQVKRNRERFPEEFMFQLTDEEFAFLRSQNATLETGSGKHRKYLPYVFTEQGVAMLSAVLRSKTAVKISIQIIKAFVAMRKFITTNAQIFHRIDSVEQKQLEHKAETDEKFDRIFNAIESKEITPKQGVFFDGQIFDAYQFASDLIRKAKKSIIIIDNYIDDSVLLLLTKRKKRVTVKIFTKTISKQQALDIKKFNEQYPAIEIKEFKNSHDRFIIIDNTTVYHFGASLKDLGKKWFAFSKMDIGAVEMLTRLEGLK